ncbi:NSS family neurotransmitter:Na+ symporter [Clostridium tetanomorphum]|uniref:Sodium-dependent transporter n=1 Tax=Clostridium tetanomorphum TaxID=1553 RepID=A0A923E9S9_CLOTT|nr:sodium-dependent transporter [Clostridium tetanomorphum]KAJ50088.1 sodium- and chloride-dependent transporter, tyrosine transporter [Clostridium tetanomorphum DSM 665]MBC2399242.1 sodium-dependent transporter [Clostridium tetanomorphum]MBP1862833.1 NSS family neurotransmitter:Na+ symporter [Clostridium tetanomorphum]NRS86970.1 NSS family neurotransmitter:Na+ symporter [Clostridium tetanomorphum]NRZ99246.1 NSS family neurotransmitter:Na+ symporter [Clostridium tetanomorphum]
MENKSTNTNKFASKWGFILACVGSAVGMANVWGFPYKLGSNGGGAFLIAYLIFIVLFSYIGLSAEYAIGRRAKTGTVGAYENAWKSGGKEVISKYVGWLPLAGSMCIAIGYSVIISYVLKGWTQSVTGSLMTIDTGKWFESFAMADYSVIPYHLIVVIGTLITLILGADSIEKSNKVMMPLFFILFVILAVRVAFLPGAVEGYKFMFLPRWEALADPMVWVWAMGQAFFSLSVTGSGMIVYGSYLSDDADIVNGAVNTAIFDTIAAMVAALVIIPACFAYKVDVGSGPGLLFVTLPKILQNIPLGRVFAIILFTAVVFGGVSSLQNMFEVVGESLMYKFPKLKRVPMLILLGVICFSISVNMEPIFKWGPWMDFVSIYIIPIGATLGAVSWFWIMKKEDLLNEINLGAKKKQGDLWYNIGKYLYVPFAILLCIIALFMKVSF